MSNTMKAFILFIMFTISFLCNHYKSLKTNEKLHDFYNGFLKTIYGDEFNMGDDCLIGKSEANYEKFELSLVSMDIFLISINLQKVIADINTYCPLMDFKRLLTDFWDSIVHNHFCFNILKHSPEIFRIIKDEIFSFNFKPYHIGEVYGRIIKLGVFNTFYNKKIEDRKEQLKFLA